VSPAPRDVATRTADALSALTAPTADAWVATASADGAPHLVPLTIAWHDERILLAVEGRSLTARNVVTSGRARLGIGPTRDVVVVDATLDRCVPVDDEPSLGDAYGRQADWDPRGDDAYVFLVLRPVRIQAWRDVAELEGRTLMRDGLWLAPQPSPRRREAP